MAQYNFVDANRVAVVNKYLYQKITHSEKKHQKTSANTC